MVVDLLFVRKYDEAVKAFREALEINPTQGVAEINICNALFLAGRYEEGLEMLRLRWKGNEEYIRALDEGYAEAGFRGAMKKLADLRAEKTKVTHLNQMQVLPSIMLLPVMLRMLFTGWKWLMRNAIPICLIF